MNARHVCLAFLVPLALVGLACDDDPVEPEPPVWSLLPSTPPENLLANLQTIYNDTGHSALERLVEFEKLFLHAADDPPHPGFVFHVQPVDVMNGLPESWGLSEEIEAHRGLFTAQADSAIYSLLLQITHGATGPIEADPERVDWEEIFASNVYLRLMLNPNDGLEVNGGQAEFEFAPDTAKPPAEGARFYGGYWIAEWTDLPRPSPLAAPAVEGTTWGQIKSIYMGYPWPDAPRPGDGLPFAGEVAP